MALYPRTKLAEQGDFLTMVNINSVELMNFERIRAICAKVQTLLEAVDCW